MRLDRLGAMHQTRLSFLRATLRRLHDEKWRIGPTRWNIEPDGVGVAVYTAEGIRTLPIAWSASPTISTPRSVPTG